MRQSQFIKSLREAIDKKDGKAILSLFCGMSKGNTSILLDDYLGAINCCGEEYEDAVKVYVARALLTPTAKGVYPILNLYTVDNDDNTSRPYSLIDCVDEELSYYILEIGRMLRAQKPGDYKSLRMMLYWLESDSLFMRQIMRCFVGTSSIGAHPLMPFLIQYVANNRELTGILKDHKFTLNDIKENIDLFSEKEIFALVFIPDGLTDPYSYKMFDEDYAGESEKERLLLLAYWYDNPENRKKPAWIEAALNDASIYVRLMALKAYSNGCYNKNAFLLRAFAGVSPASVKDINEYFYIYPYDLDFEEENHLESFFERVLNEYGHGNDYTKLAMYALWHMNEKREAYLDIVCKLLEDLDTAEPEYYNALLRAVQRAIIRAVEDGLRKDFIRLLCDLCDFKELKYLEPNRDYYIKCHGGDAVAVVKICTDELWPAAKEYIKQHKEDSGTLIADGLDDLFFTNAKTNPNKLGSRTPLLYKVDHFIGSVYGSKKYFIKSDNYCREIKVGELFKPDKNTPIYYSLEMAQKATFDF